MQNSMTIQSTDENGNSFQITLKKTGPDTGFIEVKKLNAPPEDHPFNIVNVKASKDGTRIACTASVVFNPSVTCVIADNPVNAPTVEVDVDSFIGSLHEKYRIAPVDFTALTKFVAGAGFPVLT